MQHELVFNSLGAFFDLSLAGAGLGPMRKGMRECVSCGQEISIKAKTCPHCSHRYVLTFWDKMTERGVAWFVTAIVLLTSIIALSTSS